MAEEEGGLELGGITQTEAHGDKGEPRKGRGRRRGQSQARAWPGSPQARTSPGAALQACPAQHLLLDGGDVHFTQSLQRDK